VTLRDQLPPATVPPRLLLPSAVPTGDARNASLSTSWVMNNLILLEEQLIKKSQQKRRTSPSNFKVRFFVLTKASLAYFEDRHGVCERFLLSFIFFCNVLNLNWTNPKRNTRNKIESTGHKGPGDSSHKSTLRVIRAKCGQEPEVRCHVW
jgi:hypothetical protein